MVICRNASFAYDGGAVVSSLNFTVESGDYLCIVGENGSGKSTLVKGILGLMSPFGGEVELCGLSLCEIGYLPQQTAAQKDFPAGVFEVVLSGRLGGRGLKPLFSRADKAEAEGNMRRLGIEHLKRRCYRELSGGQQQLVLLARALCATRKLLLLDEPAAGLDPVITQEMYAHIEKVNRETGITVIMVSHDIRSAVKYARHILHLKNTQMFFGETPDYVRSAVGAAFLGASGDAEHGEG
ncbi:MAG: ABC transporter ATP-binding protein [Oscillospiraceae bacterium]|nr:ABC transporter ATP-binding protein [Oscillospiraceae bacterium]